MPTFVLVVNRYAVHEVEKWQYAKQNRAVRTTQGGVTLTVMDCVIVFIRFRISDQVYTQKSEKQQYFV